MAKSSWEGPGKAPPAVWGSCKGHCSGTPIFVSSQFSCLLSQLQGCLPLPQGLANRICPAPPPPMFLNLQHFYKDSPVVGVELNAKFKAVSEPTVC